MYFVEVSQYVCISYYFLHWDCFDSLNDLFYNKDHWNMTMADKTIVSFLLC